MKDTFASQHAKEAPAPIDAIYKMIQDDMVANNESGQRMSYAEMVAEAKSLFPPLVPRASMDHFRLLDRQGLLKALITLRMAERKEGTTGLVRALLQNAIHPPLSDEGRARLEQIAAMSAPSREETNKLAGEVWDMIFTRGHLWRPLVGGSMSHIIRHDPRHLVEDTRRFDEHASGVMIEQVERAVVKTLDEAIDRVSAVDVPPRG